MTSRRSKSAPYQVGYGKPPRHTRFRKGQSGNPGGRPRRPATERAKALALREAYRRITVKEGDRAVALPAIQAILRSQIVLATKGNVQAQRAVLAAIHTIEEDSAEVAALAAQRAPIDYNDAARRIAFLLRLGGWEEKKTDGTAQSRNGATQSGSGETSGPAPQVPSAEAKPR